MFHLPLGPGAELRPLEPYEAPTFLALIEREREHFGQWLPWAISIDDEAKAKDFLDRLADRQSAGQGRGYAIWLHDEMVGGLLFRVFNVEAGNCEIGVWLAKQATGRGLITTGANHLIDWAFTERGMRRVEWHTASGNLPSSAVARRLGMQCDGILREAFDYRGTRHDVEVWSLLATDPRPTPRALISSLHDTTDCTPDI
jgi:ribosomal-protein-serine acetyltransferase